ncbi:MAG: hypothetical protein WAX89_01360 [Alphaproteobacteria bacterium]
MTKKVKKPKKPAHRSPLAASLAQGQYRYKVELNGKKKAALKQRREKIRPANLRGDDVLTAAVL